MNTIRVLPPRTARVHVYDLFLENGREITRTENLTWHGEVWIRSDADMDPLYKLHSSDSWAYVELGMFQFIGKNENATSLSDIAKKGGTIELP